MFTAFEMQALDGSNQLYGVPVMNQLCAGELLIILVYSDIMHRMIFDR